MVNNVAPTVVGFYHLDRERWTLAARVYLDPNGTARLKVIDPRWSRGLVRRFEGGVHFPLQDRAVRTENAADFMRGLLEPINASYYKFVDESVRHKP
jgi:hypothetical protein